MTARDLARALASLLLAGAAAASVKGQAPRDDGLHLTPLGRTGSEKHVKDILSLAERMRSAPPPDLTERERKESEAWMREANPAIRHTLTGHRVVILATDGFAKRARENDLTLQLDVAYEVFKDLTGLDPIARVGRRFFVWPDPGKPGGLMCVGREIRIHVGKIGVDNADRFEDFAHEMFHGFQFENPAGSYMCGGLFEGWAQFAQAIAVDALAPIGKPLTNRFAWYAEHFPNSARHEYLQTRLPIEEIVGYDPSSGLLMELVKTTADPRGRPDWTPVRQWLRGAAEAKPWVPWDLWPALLAREALRRFDPVKVKPLLVKYRFPLDKASLGAVDVVLQGKSPPVFEARKALADLTAAYPIPNPGGAGPEGDPFDAENACADPLLASNAGLARGVKVPAVMVDGQGAYQLDKAGAEPRTWALTGKLPAGLEGPLTLFVASSCDVALYLDGERVHGFRGARSCDPLHPDVAYVNATGPGRLLAVLSSRGGGAAFHLAASPGGLFFEGLDERAGSSSAADREAAALYVASRRTRSLTRERLLTLLADSGARVRAAAAWGLGRHRDDPAVVEALVKALRAERDAGARQALRDTLEELTFESFAAPADAERWWKKNAAPFASWSYAEAEDAFAVGTIAGGGFGNQEGAYGRQCVARAWGADPANWLSVVLTARHDGPVKLRIRFACANGPSTLRVRVRRGDAAVFEAERVELPATASWTDWKWVDVDLPALTKGRYHVDLLEPRGGPDIDVVGWRPK